MLQKKPKELSHIPDKDYQVCLVLLKMFQIDGKPANELATPGQIEIFWALVFRRHKRVNILCSTQYGKSLFVALACVVIACIQEEVVAVVAPTGDKAKIIMRYFVEHLGDNPVFESQLEADTKLERLRQEGSKERITLRGGGGIFAVSVQTNNSMKTVEAAMGLGAKNVIMDEACLIPDDTESTVYRMIAGKGPDAFYCKIGNPFYRDAPYTHFYKTSNSKKYFQIFIDHHKALQEGRYTEEFVAEAKEKPQFDILYACLFPKPGIMDKKGWTPLLTTTEIERAMEDSEGIKSWGEMRMGTDPAEGGDDSAIVIRSQNVAFIAFADALEDSMQFVGHSKIAADEYDITPGATYLELDGLGGPIAKRMSELGYGYRGFRANEEANDKKSFYNKNAEAYWRLRVWIKQGGKLFRDKRWLHLADIRYSTESNGTIRMMPKNIFRKEFGYSPDIPDALRATFVDDDRVFRTRESPEEEAFNRRMREKKVRQARAKKKKLKVNM